MASAATSRTPAQLFALVFGTVYLVVGLVGFFVTGFDHFFGHTFNDKLLLFAINPGHNLVHIGLGAIWLGAARDHAAAKGVNMIFGAVLLVVFLLGMLGVLKFIAIEGPGSSDNYLHLVTGGLAVYFGSAGAERRSAATA